MPRYRPSRLERFATRFDQVPEWLRPLLYGPLLVVAFALSRGLLFFLPVILLVAAVQIAKSDSPGRDLVHGIFSVGAVLGLVLGGSVAGGAAYSLVGRYLRHIPFVGSYLAGILSVAPYAVSIVMLLRLRDGQPLLSPLDDVDLAAVALLSTIFGLVLGHLLIRDPSTQKRCRSA